MKRTVQLSLREAVGLKGSRDGQRQPVLFHQGLLQQLLIVAPGLVYDETVQILEMWLVGFQCQSMSLVWPSVDASGCFGS